MQPPQSSMIPVNPFHARARPDPYPLYQYMRTVEPVHRSQAGFWILTRYADCHAVLEDPGWSHDADSLLEPARGELEPVDPTVRLLRASILFQDPPRHAAHRRPLEAAVRSGMKGAEARLEKIASQLITLMREKESGADLIRDYVAPLPLVFLCDLMGIPAADRSLVQRWGRELVAGLDPLEPARGVVVAGAAAAAMVEYMLGRLDAGARSETNGAMSHLRPGSGGLSTWEVVADMTTFIVMGVETSIGLIGNGLLALLRQQDALVALKREPARIDAAIEELIRFDGPIHLTARATTRAAEVGGYTVGPGEPVLVLIAAANRDPAQFADADRLVLDRAENAHLGFGLGRHLCFAAPLARIIGRIAMTSLLTKLDGLELAGQPDWNPTVTVRSLRRLPISWRA